MLLIVTKTTEDGSTGNLPPKAQSLGRRPKYKQAQPAQQEEEEDEEEEVRPWQP